MTNMMNRRGNANKFNGNGNNHAFFDKYHMIPKEVHAALSPETKECWNSIPNKEKISILISVRVKPTPKPTFPAKKSFSRKVNNSEIIEGLLHDHTKVE